MPETQKITTDLSLITVDNISVTPYPMLQALFEDLVQLVNQAVDSTKFVTYLNVHVANQAQHSEKLRQFLQNADMVYCDGAGIQLGARLLGQHIPSRFTAADWFLDLLGYLAHQGLTVYFIGGAEDLPRRAKAVLDSQVPNHSVIGLHHGYLTPESTQAVINDIHRLKPDIVIVGMGTPHQEHWIADHRHLLADVKLVYAIGATLDYFVGNIPRCPAWMGNNGLEWLYRLGAEPTRLFTRYVVGNPQFLFRILRQRMALKRLSDHHFSDGASG